MQKIRRNNDLITSELEDELVMLDIEHGKYFSLNPVAKRIWELLEIELTTDELVLKLLQEFEVEIDQCKKDTENYINELITLNLVVVSDEA